MPIKRKFQPIVLNMAGAIVTDCQKLLVKAGSTIKVNGEFTIGMFSAVKAFQKKNGLPVTGKVDEKTMKALMVYAKPQRVKKSPAKKTGKK
ncbi:MAG: peptidoglycan-binding protein [Clostridiales bacterium]|nr:peptidoglycan-binding protein [Clostridiales bacterium]